MLSYLLLVTRWGTELSHSSINSVAKIQNSIKSFLAEFNHDYAPNDSKLATLICNNPDSYIKDRQNDAKLIHSNSKANKAPQENSQDSCCSTDVCCCDHGDGSPNSCSCSHDEAPSSLLVMTNQCQSQELVEFMLKKLNAPSYLETIAWKTSHTQAWQKPLFPINEKIYSAIDSENISKVPIAA